MSNPFTIYAIGNQLYQIDGLEDPATASARMLLAHGYAEDLVAYSIFAPIEDELETAFPANNPGLHALCRDLISVERLSDHLTKEDAAEIYVVTMTTTRERRMEPVVDHLQKGANTWKVAHSASMPLSQFVNEHVDLKDDPTTLQRIATDVGQCRLVQTNNLERTMAELEGAGDIYPYPSKETVERCKKQMEQIAEIHEKNMAVWRDQPLLRGPK